MNDEDDKILEQAAKVFAVAQAQVEAQATTRSVDASTSSVEGKPEEAGSPQPPPPSAPGEVVEASPAPSNVLPLAPPIRSLDDSRRDELRALWAPVVASYKVTLQSEGRRAGGLGRYMHGAERFVRWAVARNLTPAAVNDEHKRHYAEYITNSEDASITKNIHRPAGIGMVEEAIIMRSIPPEEREERMARQPPQQPPEEVEPTEEAEAEAPEEEYVEEAPPPKRAPRQPQVQYVPVPMMAQPRVQRQPPRAPPRQSVASRLLGRTETIRIYKRGPVGKLIYVDDYSVDELRGGPVHKFIKEFVDPEYADGSGLTTYEVFEVAPDGTDKGAPVTIPIESGVAPQPDSTMTQARSALSLLQELREMAQKENGPSAEVLKAAQKKAVEGQDTNSLMMLMMMERMLGNNGMRPEEAAIKLIEKMRGGGSLEHPPMYQPPPPPPPVQMMPPPPAPPSELVPVVQELLKAQVSARPESKSFADQVKELMLLRELFNPGGQPQVSPEVVALRAEVAALREKAAAPAQGGIDGALQTFDKLTNVVKTLAPQVNMGGLTGALQNILTPKLANAVGDMLAGGIMQARGQQPALSAPAQSPPMRVPDAVKLLEPALKAATDEKTQVEQTLYILQAYYEDAVFKSQLEPVLQQLMIGNREPAISVVLQTLSARRPDLANRVFAEKVIDALIKSATGATGAEPAPAVTPPPLEKPTETVPLETAPAAPAATATVDTTATATPPAPSNGVKGTAVEQKPAVGIDAAPQPEAAAAIA